MRCSKCGKRIKKNSSFCMKCGAKVPPVPKKEKKSKKNIKDKKGKKKRSKRKIVILFLILLILGSFSFLVFGGDLVPEKIRNIKGYSNVTGFIKEKIPDRVKLPFGLPELPFQMPSQFTFELPFELPSGLLGEGEIPDKEKIMEDLVSYKGKEESKVEVDSLEIEKRITVEEKKEDTVFVTAEVSNEKGSYRDYFRLVYKKRLIGGWKLDEVAPYNVDGEEQSIVGVDNKDVLSDPNLFADIPADWKTEKVKVLEHFTDVKAGTDTVLVYVELKTSYVNLTGTKTIIFQYDEQTKKWASTGPATKLNCFTIEPVGGILQP